MRDLWKVSLSIGTPLKRLVPAMACGILVAFSGHAYAQAQPTPCGSTVLPGWRMNNNPSLDDQRAITDLLSGYAWAIDDRDAPAFVALFEPSNERYELCNTSGSVFVLPNEKEGLLAGMQAITQELDTDGIQTRHLLTNTMFDVGEDGIVYTRSTLLVTVQLAILEKPQLDYTGDARATLVKDKDGVWKIRTLTVHADTSAPVAKKR